MPNLYHLKVSLLEPHYPINQLHRVLEVKGSVTFYELHQALFDAFDRHDEHLWKFIITRKKSDGISKLYDCQEQVLLPDDFLWEEGDDSLILHKANTPLDALNLTEKDYFYYWFDFGDDWIHRIRVEKIEECSKATRKLRLTKKIGTSPAQYESDEPEDTDDIIGSEHHPHNEPQPPNKQPAIPPELDFELTLMSAMMMIAVGDEVRYQDLVQMGIADTLVTRGLIKPCINPAHRVRLTVLGESEIVRFMEMAGIGRR
ncbi:MAG: hypothetical protein Q4C68_00305 [Moraxella sp.]|nr:hypothetical protein [Moraxella sp.]